MVDRKFTFNGSFKQGCQEAAVPPSLLALINLIMEGPTIKRQTAVAANAAALSISQLLIFNSVKRRRSEISTLARHSPERETPLPLYLAMKIHAVTRSRNLIDSMFSIGWCFPFVSNLQPVMLSAHRKCERGSTLTIIQLQQLQRTPSTAPVFHLCNFQLIRHRDSTVVQWLSIPLHPQVSQLLPCWQSIQVFPRQH